MIFVTQRFPLVNQHHHRLDEQRRSHDSSGIIRIRNDGRSGGQDLRNTKVPVSRKCGV